MSVIDKFLSKYTEIESFVKRKNPNIDNILDDKCFGKNIGTWKFYKTLRNLLTHQDNARNGKFINLTNELYTTFAAEADRIMYPPKAIDIAIPLAKIYRVTGNERVNTVIQVMLDKNYTCSPILDKNGAIEGVFSSHSLMLYFNKHKQEIIEETNEICMKDLKDFCELYNDPDVHYRFIPKTITVDEVKEMVKDDFNNNKRLEVIFITDNGKPTEKILALLTPWDLNKCLE
ncbi:MAG: CBS domain-containing protein [Alphaproteobacteria bacterium]|nr:CBS domain-containing protein [Alphaproteobacteria bacterium]